MTQLLLEELLDELLELVDGAGVAAGAAEVDDELLESPLVDVDGVELDDAGVSEDPALVDELEPPRLSVL